MYFAFDLAQREKEAIEAIILNDDIQTLRGATTGQRVAAFVSIVNEFFSLLKTKVHMAA